MSRRTRRGIILLALLAGLSVIFARDRSSPRSEPFANLDTRLNYALYDFDGTLMNDAGGVNLKIRSPVLRNNAESGIGTVEQPEIRIQQEDDRWYITAETAVISSDREQVSLVGEVDLTRIDQSTGRRLDINSRDVLLNVTPRTAFTEAEVAIRQDGDRLNAVGMKLDMIARHFELLHEVQAHYEIP